MEYPLMLRSCCSKKHVHHAVLILILMEYPLIPYQRALYNF